MPNVPVVQPSTRTTTPEPSLPKTDCPGGKSRKLCYPCEPAQPEGEEGTFPKIFPPSLNITLTYTLTFFKDYTPTLQT